MRLPKLFIFLFLLSLITSCSPEVLADTSANDGSQATNDNTIVIDNGSKR
ncbi:hypothetical protein [Aequorivita ciconiae]|nr:hypothetical protein [Aequorivita sp. H23M31]